MGGRVDGDRDPFCGPRVSRECGQGVPVGGGVGDEDVGVAVPGEPERLGQGEGHEAAEAVHGEDAVEECPAAYGLGGHPDGLAGGAAYEAGGVGPQGGEVEQRERRFEGGGGPVVPLPIIHTGSVSAYRANEHEACSC
ncbi:hypothetical protein GCM10020001_066870 [Nonomuraea salmonea]